jgi:hypothetical protein
MFLPDDHLLVEGAAFGKATFFSAQTGRQEPRRRGVRPRGHADYVQNYVPKRSDSALGLRRDHGYHFLVPRIY